jgi:hypothetical protein
MIAQVLGIPFLGFALTIAIGSPLLDYIGMRLLLPLSGVCFTSKSMVSASHPASSVKSAAQNVSLSVAPTTAAIAARTAGSFDKLRTVVRTS